MSSTEIRAQTELTIKWKQSVALPAEAGQKIQPGLAGAVIGISNDQLIVAGGANFGDTLPWKGGIKKYHDEIYLQNLGKGSKRWIRSETKLPAPLAYSACAVCNGSLISIGGEGPDGPVPDVFILSAGPDGLEITPESPLPEKVSSAGAAVIGKKIYLAGGLNADGATSSVYCAETGSGPLNWEKLPDMPFPLSHALVIAQHDGRETCLFVIGGRTKTGPTSTFFATIWKYIPSKKRWEPSGELTGDKHEPMGLSAGTGIPIGDRHILIIGGDAGIIFNQTEELINRINGTTDPQIREKWVQEKNALLEKHPGFKRHVLLLDCQTGLIRRLPDAPVPLPVTTNALVYENRILIPSGEVRPGVRTPWVLKAEFRLR